MRPGLADQPAVRRILPALLIASCLGCSDAQMNTFVIKLFEPQRTAPQNMVLAFASEDPDVRRDSLAKVAESDESDREWAIKGYVTVALLDTDPQARCVALRALARTGDPRATDTALKILNYRRFPADVQPPTALVRWDATEALADLSAADAVPAERREEVATALIERLRTDTDRHARVAAARGLAHHQRPEVLEALIRGLDDREFVVVHRCEQSLIALTGVTHDCRPLAWEEWYAEHVDTPFAHAGETPDALRPPYSNRFEKLSYDMKRFFRWLVPAKKE